MDQESHLRLLTEGNRPYDFWAPGAQEGREAWECASRLAAPELGECAPKAPRQAVAHADSVIQHCLGEGQFGVDRYRLSNTKRIYYRCFRPVLPKAARPILRSMMRRSAEPAAVLGWPIEDRYVRYLERVLAEAAGQVREPFKVAELWPDGSRFALVLTHDVEGSEGLGFVPKLLEIDAAYGFRSSFNFVPLDYKVDVGLLKEIRDAGCEVGVHGLRHDGRLFASPSSFSAQAKEINRWLHHWGSVGFRSPMTHRNPSWMQDLDVEYDSSWFDTDPYEPMPGGCMSIWPFFIGRFVELPYTLPQDHTVLMTLGEQTPRLWIDKTLFVREHSGMALLNAHPDYLAHPRRLDIYRQFLEFASNLDGAWRPLPKEVARWWRSRHIRSDRGTTS